MNRKIVFLCALFALAFANVYSQKSELKWQQSPLKIDGNENDWITAGKTLRFYDSSNQLSYELRNDSVSLYFVLKSDNPFLQHQISRAGMKLKLNIKEKNKRTATFTIEPKKGMPEQFSPQRGQQQSLDELAKKEETFPKDTAYLQGFQFSKNYVLSGENMPDGFLFDISKGRKAEKTVFELQIPLRELFGEKYNLNQIDQIPLQLQLTIDAPSRESNFSQMRGGMNRGGGMGHRGGEMGGAPGGGMGGPGGGEMGGGFGGGREGGGEMEGGGEGFRQQYTHQGGGFSMEKKDMKFDFFLTNKKSL